MRVISIDPGAVHCGIAHWAEDEGLWQCIWAKEMSPEGCVDFVREAVNGTSPPSLVIVEGFWLKPGMDALRQAGSQMETCEVIGVVVHSCRWAGVPCAKVANGQQSIITRLEAVDYRWVSHGYGKHAKDAEAVGVRGLGLKVRQLRQIAEARAAHE